MTNFERYNALHDEVMKRLQDGEVTIESARDVINLAFKKYIVKDNTPTVNGHNTSADDLERKRDDLERKESKARDKMEKIISKRNKYKPGSEEYNKYEEERKKIDQSIKAYLNEIDHIVNEQLKIQKARTKSLMEGQNINK